MKIGKIYNELLLSEDFKTQTEKFISQGYSKEIVDRYINDFKEIRDKKYKEARDKELPNLNVPVGEPRFNIDNYKTFKELEVLVDYVAGQRKFGSANFEDIKIDGEPIFKNKDVEIFYADTPRACIQYKGNKPYGWCVSRSDSSNMFYNYRLQEHEPAFYFVKRIAATDKEFSFWNLAKDVFSGKFKDKYHFFVIQAIKNVKIGDENTKSYIVTSAMNDGDIRMSWSEIVNIAPELRGLQKIFEPKPLSPEEREKVNKYQEGLSDEDFARLPYKEKEYYMAIYVKMNQPLTDNQFAELPEDLKNKYVGFGVGLSDKQFELIRNNSKLVKRYIEITKRKWEEYVKSNNKSAFRFTSSELNIIASDSELINKLDSNGIAKLLGSSNEKEKVINILLSTEGFINKLDSNGIANLLIYSNEKEKEKVINILLSTEGFINKLDSYDISILLGRSNEKEKVINILLSTEGFINKLDSKKLYYLLYYSKEPDKIINILGDKGKEFINKLDSNGIANLLYDSNEPDKIINILGDKGKEFINNLNSDGMGILVNNSKEKEKIINILLQSKEVINKLGSRGIANLLGNLLRFSDEPDKIINISLQSKELINELDSSGIYYLLYYSNEPDKVKSILLNNGVSKDLINQAISKYGIETKLIPENRVLIKRVLRECLK